MYPALSKTGSSCNLNTVAQRKILNRCAMICYQHFIKGVEEQFPDAELTFDKFHIVKVILPYWRKKG